MEPPMSVPQPIIEPCRDNKAASPPEEPPGVKLGFCGWVVNPQSGFSVSHHYRKSATDEEENGIIKSAHHDTLR